MVTKTLFQNARLQISDMRLAPGQSGGLDRHEFPTLRWQVGDGMHRLEGAPPAPVKDRETFWVEPGQPFRVENCGNSEYRQICWEFKSAPKRSEEAVRKLLASAKFSTDVGTKLLFENEYCRAWDFCLPPGGGDPNEPHHHVLDYGFVYVAKGAAGPCSHAMTELAVWQKENVAPHSKRRHGSGFSMRPCMHTSRARTQHIQRIPTRCVRTSHPLPLNPTTTFHVPFWPILSPPGPRSLIIVALPHPAASS
jgi:mannose-6-phosphate isomerase-like protein (cupin superfamily)